MQRLSPSFTRPRSTALRQLTTDVLVPWVGTGYRPAFGRLSSGSGIALWCIPRVSNFCCVQTWPSICSLSIIHGLCTGFWPKFCSILLIYLHKIYCRYKRFQHFCKPCPILSRLTPPFLFKNYPTRIRPAYLPSGKKLELTFFKLLSNILRCQSYRHMHTLTQTLVKLLGDNVFEFKMSLIEGRV